MLLEVCECGAFHIGSFCECMHVCLFGLRVCVGKEYPINVLECECLLCTVCAFYECGLLLVCVGVGVCMCD